MSRIRNLSLRAQQLMTTIMGLLILLIFAPFVQSRQQSYNNCLDWMVDNTLCGVEFATLTGSMVTLGIMSLLIAFIVLVVWFKPSEASN